MVTSWSWMIGLFLGATIGSFLNVVIYRMPRGLSLSNPPNSFCPKCNHALAIFPDMVPMLSWLVQRGKCRYCKATVSPRYLVVELINGIIWAGLWHQYLYIGHVVNGEVVYDLGTCVFYALAASALVAAIFIDLELYIIPDQINAFLLFVGFGYNGWLAYQHDPQAMTWGLPSSVVGGLVGVAILWGIALFGRVLFRKDAMGHGDIKMARGIGAILFAGLATISFGLAVILGAVLGVVQILLFKARPEAGGEDEEPIPEPESIGSLLKCGLGYVLCIDVIGLFFPKLYMAWFNEDPFVPVQDMGDFKVELTMIPFGPYLALGAIVATVFKIPLLNGWDAYVHSMQGSTSLLEHWGRSVGLMLRGMPGSALV